MTNHAPVTGTNISILDVDVKDKGAPLFTRACGQVARGATASASRMVPLRSGTRPCSRWRCRARAHMVRSCPSPRCIPPDVTRPAGAIA